MAKWKKHLQSELPWLFSTHQGSLPQLGMMTLYMRLKLLKDVPLPSTSLRQLGKFRIDRERARKWYKTCSCWPATIVHDLQTETRQQGIVPLLKQWRAGLISLIGVFILIGSVINAEIEPTAKCGKDPGEKSCPNSQPPSAEKQPLSKYGVSP